MKWLTTLVAALLLAQQPQEQAKPAMEEKKASIEGTVVDAVSGKPLKDASLMLTRPTIGASRSGATTDEAGHYIFTGLDAGTYILFARHPRYGFQPYGARGWASPSTPLTLRSGQELKQIDFKLQPHGVISGKVVDEEDEPLKDVVVMAFTHSYERGRREFRCIDSQFTNDLGEYRFSSLAADKYLVAAMLTKPSTGKPAEDGTEMAYLPTYYPNSPDAAGAAPVMVAGGSETGGIDIRMNKGKTVRAKGRVLGPIAGQKLRVGLSPQDMGSVRLVSARGSDVKPDGSFEITAVTPGSYLLRISDMIALRSAGVAVPVEVGDKPVNGVRTEFTQPPDVNGEIIFDGETSQKPSFGAQRIALEAIDNGNLPSLASVSDGGTFQLPGVSPGKYFVRMIPVPEGTYVSSVMLGGQRMNDDGLEIGTAGGAKLEIKLRPGAAQVEGTVQDAEGKTRPGAIVALVAASRSYLLFRSYPADQNGAFRFENITPGDYVLLSVEDMESGGYLAPEFLKLYESKGEKIELKENDRKNVTLRLIPKQ